MEEMERSVRETMSIDLQYARSVAEVYISVEDALTIESALEE